MNIRYKPKVDKLFVWLCVLMNVILLACAVSTAIFAPSTLFINVPIFLFSNYFFISPLFGYVELRDGELFVKYGFFMKRSIPYAKIRALVKEWKFYTDTMLSLKNAMEHVNIKYNSFDVTAVSVTDNDALIAAIEERRALFDKK